MALGSALLDAFTNRRTKTAKYASLVQAESDTIRRSRSKNSRHKQAFVRMGMDRTSESDPCRGMRVERPLLAQSGRALEQRDHAKQNRCGFNGCARVNCYQRPTHL